MKRILSPIINLVSLILVGVAFGLAGLTAATQGNKAEGSAGSYYTLVWNPYGPELKTHNVLGIVGFFLLCVAALVLLVAFLPKIRKFVAPVGGLMLIGAGVLALLTPKQVNPLLTNKPGLIAMAVLLFVAAAFELVITALEFMDKGE